MDEASLDMSGELGDQLESSKFVDPREVPTRFSLLKRMSLSPAHYLSAVQQPQDDSLAARLGMLGGIPKRSEALRFGAALHLMLLGDIAKVGRFAGRRAGKAWTDFQEECAVDGVLEILNEREWAIANGVAGAVRANTDAMRLLFDGTAVETRIDWTYVGKACRSTPDACTALQTTDLKSCQSSQPEVFARAALRTYFYHAQAWLYGEALCETTGKRPSDAYIVAVEKTAPFPVSVLRITDRALEQGAKLCRTWVERLNACEASNQWPEYLQDIGELDIWDPNDGLDLEFNGKRVQL